MIGQEALEQWGDALWLLDGAGRQVLAANAQARALDAAPGGCALALAERLGRRTDLLVQRSTWAGQPVLIALAAAGNSYRLAARAAGLTIFDWDLRSGALRWTCEGGDAFGYDTAVFPGHLAGWLDRVHPADRGRMAASVTEVPPDRDQWQDRYQFLRADGSVAQVLDRGYVLRDAAGRALRMVGAMLDVSDLHETETRFHEVTAAASEVLFILDFDTGRDWWSAALTRHYGHPAQPAEGQAPGLTRWLALVHPDDRSRVAAGHLAALGSDQDEWQGEYRLIHADGRHVPVLNRVRFVRHADGRVSRSVGTIVDISALREREERFRLAAQAAQTVIYQYEPHSGRIWRSDTYGPTFGLDPRAGASGPGSWREALLPEDYPRIRAAFDAAIAGGQDRWEYAYRVRCGDGRVAHVIDRALAQRDAWGRLICIIGAIIDITPLREEQNRLSALLHVAADAIYDIDLRGQNVFFSEGMMNVFGLDWEGQRPRAALWAQALHPDDRDRVVRGFNAFIAGRREDWRAEYRLRRGDGRFVHVRDRARALRDDTGEAFRIIGSMQDVSTEVETADRLHQAQKLDAIGKLTGGVAHDFNNLLSVILGNAELLAEGASGEDAAAMARAIAQAAARGADLVASLLSFARRQPLQPRALAPEAVLAELMRMLERTLPADVTLQTALPSGLWPIEADPTQLQAALLNLAVNACDAMPGGGRLTIAMDNLTVDADFAASHPGARPGDYLRIALTDTGSGMAPDVLARVFDPFFTTKPAGQGSGLGLSMVHGFASQSGGHVSLYSEPGIGTTVRLMLPRATGAELPAGQPVGAAPQVPQGGGEHIVVAEDDPALRHHVKRLVESLGYRVTAAADGAAALAAIRAAGDVALLFTDVVMPGELSGRQLAERALAERPGLRVLFTSGYADSFVLDRGRIEPGVHLLTKPYPRDELARRLHDLLHGADPGAPVSAPPSPRPRPETRGG